MPIFLSETSSLGADAPFTETASAPTDTQGCQCEHGGYCPVCDAELRERAQRGEVADIDAFKGKFILAVWDDKFPVWDVSREDVGNLADLAVTLARPLFERIAELEAQLKAITEKQNG